MLWSFDSDRQILKYQNTFHLKGYPDEQYCFISTYHRKGLRKKKRDLLHQSNWKSTHQALFSALQLYENRHLGHTSCLFSLSVWYLTTSIWMWRLKKQISVFIGTDVFDIAAHLVSAVEKREYSMHYKVILHRIWTDAQLLHGWNDLTTDWPFPSPSFPAQISFPSHSC